MADMKHTADSTEQCYSILALIAGTRGILTELQDHAVPESDGFINVDRLLGEVVQRLKDLAETVNG